MKTFGWMVVIALWTVIGLTVGNVAWRMVQAQEKPPAAAPQEKPPEMPPDQAIKLRDAVLAQAKLVIQLKDTIATYNTLQGSLQAQAKVLDTLKLGALAAAKLDPEKWDVDLDKFVFVAKPAPPAEVKKP